MEKLSIKELYTAIDKLTNGILKNKACPFFEAIQLTSDRVKRSTEQVCSICPLLLLEEKGCDHCKSYKPYNHYDYLNKPSRIPQLKKDFIKRFPTVLID